MSTLVCHFFNMPQGCKNTKCKFQHPKVSFKYCPNGLNCPIPHLELDCPLQDEALKCSIENCTFRHRTVFLKTQKEETKQQKGDVRVVETSDGGKKKRRKKRNRTPVKDDRARSRSPSPVESSYTRKSEVRERPSTAIKKPKVSVLVEKPKDPIAVVPKPVPNPVVPQKKVDIQDSISNDAARAQKYSLRVKKGFKFHEDVQNPDNAPAISETQGLDRNKNDTFSTFQMRMQNLHQDLMIFEPYRKRLLQQKDLDIMFIVDCTGSMSSWIKACKDEINKIIISVKEQYDEVQVRFSFIGYRDFCDRDKSFSVLEFTQDVDVAKKFLEKVSAYGGGDLPEDVCGGFEHALNQDWKATAKYAILIADAPCHGSKYHGSSGDSYEGGDPQNRVPEDQIRQFAKRGISFYGVKITSLTDKMYEILSNAYLEIAGKNIEIADLGDSVANFGFFISSTAIQTLTQNSQGSEINQLRMGLKILNSLRKEVGTQLNFEDLSSKFQTQFGQVISEKSQASVQKLDQKKIIKIEDSNLILNKILEKPLWWALDQQTGVTLDATCHTFFIVKDKGVDINWKKPLLQNSQIQTKIQVCQYYFAEGAMRYAFYAKDLALDQNMVAKLPKILNPQTYTLDVMKKELEAIFICQNLVNEYNDRVVNFIANSKLMLNFVHTFIYEIKPSNNFPVQFYFAENFIPGKYEKFNNNAGWISNICSESSFISQAFSHFSYQFTKGYLMVVDLQGTEGLLTDPQIHCQDPTRFGQGNLCYEGILKFFATHICNNYCKKLGLTNPRDQTSEKIDPEFFNQTLQAPKNPNEQIKSICDLCREPFSIKAQLLYEKRRDCFEKYCPTCNKKKKETFRSANCENQNCKEKFTSSEYWFKMKRTDFPTLCSKCRLERRNRMRKELEELELKG